MNVSAQSNFPLQVTESYIHQDSDTSSTSSSHINNTETDNQLVWSNPIHNTLNPQIARQLAYSDTLLNMAQSAKISLGVKLFWESRATLPIETMVFQTKDGDNGTR